MRSSPPFGVLAGPRLAVAALAVFAAATSCAKAPRKVVLGVAVSASYRPALSLAVKEINAAGGAGGLPVELLGLDQGVPSTSDSAAIGRWVDGLAETRDLVAVIGPSDSTSALVVARSLNERRIPQVITIATHPLLTNVGPWTYRLCISDAAQGPALAEYAVGVWGKKRIAIFAVNDDYGHGLAQTFANRVRKLGGDVLSTTTHPDELEAANQAQIRATVVELKKASPDLVVLFQRPAAARFTVKAMRDAGLATSVLGGDTLDSPDLLRDASATMNGVRFSGFFFPRAEDALSLRFRDAYRSATGTEPDYGNAFAYDAVALIKEAVASGGPSREAVKAFLDGRIAAKKPFEGVAGRYVLGADHDARRPLFILEFGEGRHVFVKAVDAG